MTVHLLDTDVCITVLRGHDARAPARLRDLSAPAVSSVTVAELACGAARSLAPESNRAEVSRLIAAMDVVDLDADAAWHAGDIRSELPAAGTPMGGYDLLVAGIARSRGMTLVTGNVREFERVPRLLIEPW